MGNRFGRNQRRRMREQIELLTEQNANASKNFAELRDSHARADAELCMLQEEVDWAKEVVGNYSALFAPNNVRLGMPAQDRIRIDPEPHKAMTDGPGMAAASPMRCRLADLNVMLAKTQFDPVNGGLHTKVTFAAGEWGYAMDWRAVAVTPHDLLVERIAEGLAQGIVSDLKNNLDRLERDMQSNQRRRW